MIRKAKIAAWPISSLPLGLALSACAAHELPHIATSGAGLPAGTAVALAPAPGALESSEGQRIAGILGAALARRGHPVSPEAPYAVAFALSRRPAAMGITQDAGNDPKSVAWSSSPRPRYSLECRRQRVQLTLVATRRQGNEVVWKGSAQVDGCRLDAAEAERLAEDLSARIDVR